jgi:phytoene desaturase
LAARKVVVIGAGPGGLAAAMQLARAGAEVTLLERRDRVGGRTSAIERDGFRFDCGPTFFLYPRVLEEIFRSVGRDLHREVPMRRLDPQYRLVFGGGGQLDCTPNISQMEAEIARFSPNDAGQLVRYLDRNRTKLARFRPILESPFNSPLDLLRPAVMAAAPYVSPWRTVGSELQSYFSDPRLVVAFSFQAKYLGMSPFNCPSLFSILSFLEYEYGVWHPLGGCARVSERMAEIAQDLGVVLKLNEPVSRLEFDGNRIRSVHTDQAAYPADALVVNADFARAMESLVPGRLRRRWSDRQLAKKRFSCSTYMLYLAMEGIDRHVPHHTIYISKDYDQNLREIEQGQRVPSDPSFYVQNAAVTDPSLAPAGQSGLYVLVPVGNLAGGLDWSRERSALREQTIDRLERIGITDARRRIKFEHCITPAEWSTDYNIYRGATFNLAHTLGQMLHRRPRNRFEELGGVYLVGGGTHPGSGLPVIYESSRITSRLLLGDLGLSTSFIDDATQPILRPQLAEAQG